VRAVPIVVVKPLGKMGFLLGGTPAGMGAGPCVQEDADEAFHHSIGSHRVEVGVLRLIPGHPSTRWERLEWESPGCVAPPPESGCPSTGSAIRYMLGI